MPTATMATAAAARAQSEPANTQMNTRINASLKAEGDAVLARNGLTPSQAVRSLWEYLVSHDDLPDYLKEQRARVRDDEQMRRLAAVDRASGLVWKLAEESGLLARGAQRRYQASADTGETPGRYWKRIEEEALDDRAASFRRAMEGVHATS